MDEIFRYFFSLYEYLSHWQNQLRCKSNFQGDFENEKLLINYPDFFVTAAENVDCVELFGMNDKPKKHTILKSFVC